ncbi:Sun tRNA and rRNA cytosine-C5-methylases [Rhabdaerophilaceae bacterium]
MTSPKGPAPARSRQEPAGVATRRLAAHAFRRILAERRQIEDAIGFEGGSTLSLQDYSLARAILTVSFRRYGSIRAALRSRARTGDIPDAGLLMPVLVTAAAQVLYMDVPDHAAVDVAIEIIKADGDARHFANLANAILRGIGREKATILGMEDSFAMDTPEWLLARWQGAYGAIAAEAIARVHQSEPPVDLTIFGSPEPLVAAVPGTMLASQSYRLATTNSIPSLPGYAEGQFQVQDVAAALPARLIPAGPGWMVLDLCAAPGGKTAQLAATGAEVVAVERSAQRAARLSENLERLKLKAEVVIADALTFTREGFDAVLLDAPCSATGTIRRHPEIAWTKTLADILTLSVQQQKMLDAAARLVRQGGLLVFATCSLEPEEGERQVERFLTRNTHFQRRPIETGEAGIPDEMITSIGDFRALPSHLVTHGGADGFFAARLQRIG